jgi:hypothetical protein
LQHAKPFVYGPFRNGSKLTVCDTRVCVFSRSDRNALDLIERNLILAPVVKFGRSRRLVVGDVLRGFSWS